MGIVRAVLALAMVVAVTVAAQAAEITVLSGGAIEPGLKAAAAAFQKETGHSVKITFNTTPQMRKRVAAGDAFDVVIAPPAAIKEFAAAGKVEEGGMNVGRVGSGVVVRPGAPGERCACGRSFPLIDQVIGRVDDPVKLTDGRSVGRLDHIFKGLDGILEAQIRQDRRDAVAILVVPGTGFGDRARQALLRNARERLGDEEPPRFLRIDAAVIDALLARDPHAEQRHDLARRHLAALGVPLRVVVLEAHEMRRDT